MKKKLIALGALAAVATGVSAESNVTLYGRLDVGSSFEKQDFKPGDGMPIVSSTIKDVTGDQSKRTASRLGVRGREDIAGGWVAQFVMETGVNPTDASGLFYGLTREAYVAIAHPSFGIIGYGTIQNKFGDIRDYGAATSGFAAGDWGERLHGKANPFLEYNYRDPVNSTTAFSTGTGFIGRSRNALGYQLPISKDFKISLGHINHTNAVTPGLNFKSYGAGVDYAIGGFKTTLNYGIVNTTYGGKETLLVGVGKRKHWAFAARYDFGVAVPYLIAEQSKYNLLGKTTTMEVGSTFPVGSFEPYVHFVFGKMNPEQSRVVAAILGNTADIKSKGYQFGTKYNMSKRTYLYASYGQEEHDRLSQDLKRKSVGMGLVHSF